MFKHLWNLKCLIPRQGWIFFLDLQKAEHMPRELSMMCLGVCLRTYYALEVKPSVNKDQVPNFSDSLEMSIFQERDFLRSVKA